VGTAASLQIKRLAVHFVAEVIRLSRGVLNKMFRVTTRLDQVRDAINVIQRVLSELAWRELGRRELSEDQVKALGGRVR
jgi:hypothetical protein